jgi:hypothetical protein
VKRARAIAVIDNIEFLILIDFKVNEEVLSIGNCYLNDHKFHNIAIKVH